MNSERRNATVVFALIGSMTIGVGTLRMLQWWLFPKKVDFTGSALLMAEADKRQAEAEIIYAATRAEAAARGTDAETIDSVCWIEPDGNAQWEHRGPHWRLVVLGSEGDQLSSEQKKALVLALGAISEATGVDLVPIQLGSASDPRPQADDLRKFLVRKGFITG